MKKNQKNKQSLIVFSILALGLAGCGATSNLTPTEADVATAMAAVTQSAETDEATDPTEVIPTPTQVPVWVAMVNGEGITEASYLASLTQFEAAQAETGVLLTADETASGRVLENLISRMLLSQHARAGGYHADDEAVDARLTQLTEQVGGVENLLAWQTANGYSPESFREDLRLEMEATWMRETIVNRIPESMPQVEARQVFFYDEFSALRIYNQLENGASFQQVVDNNDPQDLGYLGWFPRGYLFLPEIETVAFGLTAGQYSDVIATELGYHLIEILAVAESRPLSADARLTLQMAALDTWMAEQRALSLVEINIP